MSHSQTHRILTTLIAGRDPRSQQWLSSGSILQAPNVLRALLLAVSALEASTARARRRAALPPHVGREWTAAEEVQLRAELAGNEPLNVIAARHGRSARAIELRLRKVGIRDPREARQGGESLRVNSIR
jgi:hypothetical protein